MAIRPTARARRIAEPGLLAAIAAVVHLADFFLAAGMLGSVLCPIPHAFATRRHGLRAGALAGLSAVSALAILGGPIEAAFHAFLFVAPGLSAGWALRTGAPLWRVLGTGALACGAGVAGTYYVVEAAMGIPDSLQKMAGWMVTATDWAAGPFRLFGGPAPLHDLVPGLASLPVRKAYLEALVEVPVALFLTMGFMVFLTTWFAVALLARRLGEPGRMPPVPAGARLPRLVALGYLLTCWSPPGAPAWVLPLRVNLNFLLGAPAYLVGYLTLLSASRGRPLVGLFALAAALPLYYVSVWVGLLSALQGPADSSGSETPGGNPAPA